MNLIMLGALGAGLYLATRADEAGTGSEIPRGIRNNNPGNIERRETVWQGMAGDQSADERFIVFESPVWGIRALARTLNTYRDKHGLQTPMEIISRWAPAFENDTDSYARAVASAIGIDPYSPVPDGERAHLELIKAIIKHENGVQPYPDDLIREGIKRATA